MGVNVIHNIRKDLPGELEQAPYTFIMQELINEYLRYIIQKIDHHSDRSIGTDYDLNLVIIL